MKKKKPGKNRKAKSAKKKQPASSPEKFMARFNEQSRRGNWNLVGEKIIKQLDLLTELLESEEPIETTAPQAGQVIERIVNRLAEILQRIETEGNDRLKHVAQEQMVYSARRLSDIAFDVLKRAPNKASEVMVLSLVKLIAGQCDKLKLLSQNQPEILRWIAEQNVFWPSIRGVADCYTDDFPATRDLVKLGTAITGLNLERNHIASAGFREVFRFYQKSREDISLPEFPDISNEPAVQKLWHDRLDDYLEYETKVYDKLSGKQKKRKLTKERLLDSDEFQHVRRRTKVLEGGEKPGVIWSEIKKDLHRVMDSLAQP